MAQTEEPATLSAAVLATEIAEAHAPVILDVRSEEEFAAGHIPGAINVPHTDIEASIGQLANYRAQDVVVYCVSGRRAGIALHALQKHGFSRLWHLAGDYSGWVKEGRNVEVAVATTPR